MCENFMCGNLCMHVCAWRCVEILVDDLCVEEFLYMDIYVWRFTVWTLMCGDLCVGIYVWIFTV